MPDLTAEHLSGTEVILGVAAAVVMAGYVAFIVVPACASYGRVWEKVAAGLLTLFMLATLLGVGVAVGFGVVFSYDTWFKP